MDVRTLQGRTAIVTGGASGIGGAVTRIFVERGARVVVVDLQEEAGRRIAAELGDAVVFLRGDVTTGRSPTRPWPPPSTASGPSTCW